MKKAYKLLAVILAAVFASGTTLAAQDDEDEPDPELSDLIEQFRKGQEERVQARRDLAQSMKDRPPEERGQAMRELIEDQSGEQRALGRLIRERMKEQAAEQLEASGGLLDSVDRPAAAVTDLADDVRILNEEFREARDQLLEEWRNKSDEERQESLDAFRDDLDDLRTQRRGVRDLARERAKERQNRNAE